MTKKILAIALSLMLVFSFGLVAAASSGYACECPADVECIDACICTEAGECVCPTDDDERTPLQSFLRSWGWSTLGSWLAMAATVVIAFFVTR
ncbi:MAG: hypothetical protein FWB76_02785 [Oscillospiraceae bacterium]|nr:hypothetical protein [Oscillospiraceae bacterium]